MDNSSGNKSDVNKINNVESNTSLSNNTPSSETIKPSVADPSSAKSKFSEGFGKFQQVAGIVQEVSAAKERIEADKENGDSSLKAYGKEGGRQAKDYGENKGREALKKQYERRKLAKDASKNGTQNAVEGNAKEVAKQSGKKMSKRAARKAAKKGAEEGSKVAAEKAAQAGAKVAAEKAATASAVSSATASGAGAASGSGIGHAIAAGGPYVWIAIAIIVIIIILYMLCIVLLLVIATLLGSNNNNNSNLKYYECNDNVTISTVNSMLTVPLDDYLTTVLYRKLTDVDKDESGNIVSYKKMTFNSEVYKAAVIVERSRRLASTDYNCTVNDSDYSTDELNKYKNNAKNDDLESAISSTDNQIIMDTNNLPINSDMSYFCFQSKDDDYYTLYQNNQMVPVTWVDSKQDITDDLKNGMCLSYSSQSLSLFGALYLSEEKNYDYNQILNFYFGDSISVGSGNSFSSIAGIDIKKTTGASYQLDMPIDDFLQSKGSSLQQLNNFIASSVNSAGTGTRNGVVAAAVSLINYLYDNFNTKLPYYWNGKYAGVGIPSSFGERASSASVDRNGHPHYIISFDCSGFVQWAIINGGFKNPGTGTYYFAQQFGANSCSIIDNSCLGVPGDLINSPNGHVQLIVAVDTNGGNYMVAESTGIGVVVQSRGIHTDSSGSYRILHMDEFYRTSSTG